MQIINYPSQRIILSDDEQQAMAKSIRIIRILWDKILWNDNYYNIYDNTGYLITKVDKDELHKTLVLLEDINHNATYLIETR